MNSENHMIEGSYSFMSGSASLYVTTLQSLVAIDIVEVDVFSLSCDLPGPSDKRVVWLYV